jgi:hypothetical protein
MTPLQTIKKLLRGCITLLAVMAGFSGAQIPIAVNGSVPASVNNSTAIYFPGLVNQGSREACANAAGIGYVFTYETNAMRSANGSTAENRYPFFYTYDFLNGGSEQQGTYRMFLDAWKISQENGVANLVDFGDADLASTRWVSGYDRYFKIMQNRVDKIDSFEMTDTNSLRKMKQWLFDRGNGAGSGGLLLFTTYIYGYQEDIIPSGVEAGKTIIKYWGTAQDTASQHAMTIVGYNDSVRFDFNGDKKITNTVDISDHAGNLAAKDSKVDMADWEIGAFLVVNSWGPSWGDNSFAYAPYRSLFISYKNGGIISNNRLYYIMVKKDYRAKMALKASVTDSLRNTIALSVGVSSDPRATAPAKIRSYERQFTYAGGTNPMCGYHASASIEIGLDISDLEDSLAGSPAATFFLVVDSKAKGGFVDSLSLMDYSSGTLVQTKSSSTHLALSPGTAQKPARTCVGVSWTKAGALFFGNLSFFSGALHIEKRPGAIRIRIPGEAVKTVALLDARGARCPSVKYDFDGEWVSVNGAFPSGIYFVAVATASGKTFVRKIIGGGL